MDNHQADKSAVQGLLFGITAFSLWGFGPIYFKAVEQASAGEVLAHRIIWSVVFLIVPVWLMKKWPKLRASIGNRSLIRSLFITAVLIGLNWLTFIYAVTSDRILDASMGYFILPIFNLLLARIFFAERLNIFQYFAVLLVVIGVLNQLYSFGSLPWIALSLAITFGFYGLIRKKQLVDPVLGLMVETLLLLPFALAYLYWLGHTGALVFGQSSLSMDILLMLAGPVSSLPLILFAASVNRLTYTAVALMQYIAPSMTFLIGVFVYHEPFGASQTVTFGLIWIALLLFSVENHLRRRRLKLTSLATDSA